MVWNLNRRRSKPTQLFPHDGLTCRNSIILSNTIKYPHKASSYISIMVWSQKPGDRTCVPWLCAPRPGETSRTILTSHRKGDGEAFALYILCLQFWFMDSFPIRGPFWLLTLRSCLISVQEFGPSLEEGTRGVAMLWRLPMEKGIVKIKVIRYILCAWDSAGPVQMSSYLNVSMSLRVGANIVSPLVTSQPFQSHVVCRKSGFKPKFM